MNLKTIFFLLPVCLAFTSHPITCDGQTEWVKSYVQSQNRFGCKLWVSLSDENTCLSPYSIFSCLSMIYQGARGVTSDEMRTSLLFSLPDQLIPSAYRSLIEIWNAQEDEQLVTSNQLWVHHEFPISNTFEKAITSNFVASCSPIDFTQSENARNVINDAISNQTIGKIPALLKEGDVDPLTRMMLVNTLCFKANWLYPFNSQQTTEQSFYLNNLSELSVPMMKQCEVFPYFEDQGTQIVALPFTGGKNQRSLILVLKDPSSRKRLNTPFQFSNLKPTHIDLELPRFDINYSINLKDQLKEMGIVSAFTPDADFSGIDENHNLFIQTIVHQATFSVDENGLTATASTAGGMGVTSLPPEKEIPPLLIQFNRPFSFMLYDHNSNSILFIGKYDQPDYQE